MKLKFTSDFNERIPKGTEAEVDMIEYAPEYAGGYRVRVIGLWKKPRWFSISWFVHSSINPSFLGGRK